jgi:hypothetical protein
MLPIPIADVPLSDILEFKNRRQPEIEALRVYLDDMYQKIISSADIPRAMDTEIRRLEQSLVAMNAALNESAIKKTITSLRSYIGGEFSSTLGAGLGGVGISTFIGMPPLLAGVASAGLALAVKPILSPRTAENNPLTYIRNVQQWLK